MTTETTEFKIKPQPKRKDVKSSVDAKEPSGAKSPTPKKSSSKPVPKETPKADELSLENLANKIADMTTRMNDHDDLLKASEQRDIMMQEAIVRLLSMTNGASKSRGRNPRQKVLDTKTGITYDSLSKAGKQLAPEIGADPSDSFIFYQIEKAFPGRFQRMDG
jgi:hypothetical protein